MNVHLDTALEPSKYAPAWIWTPWLQYAVRCVGWRSTWCAKFEVELEARGGAFIGRAGAAHRAAAPRLPRLSLGLCRGADLRFGKEEGRGVGGGGGFRGARWRAGALSVWYGVEAREERVGRAIKRKCRRARGESERESEARRRRRGEGGGEVERGVQERDCALCAGATLSHPTPPLPHTPEVHPPRRIKQKRQREVPF